MRGRARKETDNTRKKKKISEPKKAEMCGRHVTGGYYLHPTYFGTSSSVNRMQLSFVTEVVGGRKKKKTTEQMYNSGKWKHYTGCWLTKRQWASKTKDAICNLYLFFFFSLSAGEPQPYTAHRETGETSKSDRMERKLEKEWEITRCLWKTPLCYVPPSSH